jgi:hypothetical protein
VQVSLPFNCVHPGCFGSHFPFPSFLYCRYFGYFFYAICLSRHFNPYSGSMYTQKNLRMIAWAVLYSAWYERHKWMMHGTNQFVASERKRFATAAVIRHWSRFDSWGSKSRLCCNLGADRQHIPPVARWEESTVVNTQVIWQFLHDKTRSEWLCLPISKMKCVCLWIKWIKKRQKPMAVYNADN